MKIYLEFEREEITNEIPYQLICETMGSSVWDTGKRKRLMSEFFTEAEKKRCSDLYKQAYSWALRKGVPDTVKMTPETFGLWHRLAAFCAAL